MDNLNNSIMYTVNLAINQMVMFLRLIPTDQLRAYCRQSKALSFDDPSVTYMRDFQITVVEAFIKAQDYANQLIRDKAKNN